MNYLVEAIRDYKTPIFYPWAWAVILAAVMAVGIGIGVGMSDDCLRLINLLLTVIGIRHPVAAVVC